MTGDNPSGNAAARIDIKVAHASRVYDHLLGGTTNFEVDRDAATYLADALGGFDVAQAQVHANRQFLIRVVRQLADEGVSQFLDIGTGVPNDTNTHSIAQQCLAEPRVVCVDNDPIVVAHAHELMKCRSDGAAAFIQGDLRTPENILAQAAATLDFAQPVAIMLVAILHALGDHPDRYRLVSALVDAVPSGSYVAMSHIASDINPDDNAEAVRRLNAVSTETYVMASADEFARYFDGLELLAPGVTQVDVWGRGEDDPPDVATPFHAAVARKP